MRCSKCKGSAKNVDVIDCGIEAEYVWGCEDQVSCTYSFGTYSTDDIVIDDDVVLV
jgi:hypothetical protein